MKPFKENVGHKIAGAFSVSSKVLTTGLENLVKHVNVNGKGYSFICDAEEKIVIHPEKLYLNQKVQNFENGETILKISSSKTRTGFINYHYNNKNYYSYVHSIRKWNLYFAVAVSKSDLMAGINKQIITSSGISGFIALIIGVLIITFMNKLLMTHMNGMVKMRYRIQ